MAAVEGPRVEADPARGQVVVQLSVPEARRLALHLLRAAGQADRRAG
jgi:hypothetical protein